jgi:hypothetical protein
MTFAKNQWNVEDFLIPHRYRLMDFLLVRKSLMVASQNPFADRTWEDRKDAQTSMIVCPMKLNNANAILDESRQKVYPGRIALFFFGPVFSGLLF